MPNRDIFVEPVTYVFRQDTISVYVYIVPYGHSTIVRPSVRLKQKQRTTSRILPGWALLLRVAQNYLLDDLSRNATFN